MTRRVGESSRGLDGARRVSVAAMLVLSLAVAAACGGDADAPEVRDVVVRDSAGITIVENGAAPTRPAFVLDSAPMVDIGEGLDDDPDYQLFQVTAAVRRGDGSVVVANRGSGELRIYDAEGTFVRRIGRKGQGPGEFEQLHWVGLVDGDTILTYDFSGRRLSRFTPAGEYVGSLVLGGANTASFVTPLGMLDDGRIVANGGGNVFTGESMSGISRDTMTIVIAGVDGAVQDTLTRVIGGERSVKTGGSGGNRSVMVTSLPYGRATTFGVRGDAIAVATADSYEIRLMDPSGATRRIVRRRVEPMPVTDDDMAVLREQQFSGDMPAEIRKMMEQQLAEAPRPEMMPPYSTIFLDRAERLWVREATHAREAARWAVYDREGALIAELRLPSRFRVTDAGEDYVLGILRDEDDLERVQMYRVRAAAGVTASTTVGTGR